MAESTKELTEDGAKVTTVAEGAEATAAPPAEPGRTIIILFGPPGPLKMQKPVFRGHCKKQGFCNSALPHIYDSL